MYPQTPADLIWNRACRAHAGTDADKRGDRALRALIAFHGAAMNGGVLHAIESSSPEALKTAGDAYRYFGFDTITDMIGAAQEALDRGQDAEALEESLDLRYAATVPDDSTLVDAFGTHYRLSPESFAPPAEA